MIHILVYPAPDFYVCLSGFSDGTRQQWLNDTFNEGYWDVNMSGMGIRDFIDEGYLENPGDLDLEDWVDVGGYWNDMDGAAEFYERLWDTEDEAYNERNILCLGADFGFTDTTFNDEFGDYEEYCDDACGCEEEAQEEGDESNGVDTVVVVGIIIAVLVVAIVAILMWVVFVRKRSGEDLTPRTMATLSTEMNNAPDKIAVPQTSMGAEVST